MAIGTRFQLVVRALTIWRRLKGIDPRVLDVGLAVVLACGAIWDWTYSHDPLWRLPLQLAIAASVASRRRLPLLAFGAAVACALAIRASPGSEGHAAVLLNSYSVGRHASARWRSLAIVVLVTAVVASATSEGSASLVLLIAWLVGDLMRERAARLAAALSAADRGAAEERARIARELHDVIAHGVAVMVVQAEAAKNLVGRDAVRAGEAIETISATGREALAELRQLLEVLGSGDVDSGLQPSPGVEEIDVLVDRVRMAGQPLVLRVDGQPRQVPPAVGLAAFRVVQEGLTNAVKDAPGAATEVRVVFGTDLQLEVLDVGVPNQTAGPGARRGLQGCGSESSCSVAGSAPAQPMLEATL